MDADLTIAPPEFEIILIQAGASVWINGVNFIYHTTSLRTIDYLFKHELCPSAEEIMENLSELRSTKLLEYFLDSGILELNVYYRIGEFYMKPIEMAQYLDDIDFYEKLLKNGADFYTPVLTQTGVELPYFHSLFQHRLSLRFVRVLIHYGADINDERSGSTPLLAAIGAHNVSNTTYLLKIGAKVDSFTLGNYIANEPNPNDTIVRLLLEHGASARISLNGKHLTTYALERGNTTIANILTHYGARLFENELRQQ